MEREYRISRGVIAILAIIMSFIVLINEDISVKIAGISLFSIIAILVSFLGAKVSKLMIKIGDKISNVIFRALYYICILVVLLIMAASIWLLLLFGYYTFGVRSREFADVLGQALILVSIGCCVFIALIVPFIQTMIVLLLRKKDKNHLA